MFLHLIYSFENDAFTHLKLNEAHLEIITDILQSRCDYNENTVWSITEMNIAARR